MAGSLAADRRARRPMPGRRAISSVGTPTTASRSGTFSQPPPPTGEIAGGITPRPSRSALFTKWMRANPDGPS